MNLDLLFNIDEQLVGIRISNVEKNGEIMLKIYKEGESLGMRKMVKD